MGIVLILVITLAIVLFIAGMAQLFFSSQVYRQTARGSGGLAAEYLARSAVAELEYKLQGALTSPSHPLFRKLREALLTGEAGKGPGGLIDLSREFDCDLLVDRLESSEHRAFYRSFRVEGLTVLAGYDRSRPEQDALVARFGATARLSLGSRAVARRVEETRALGMMLAGPKRPLDQVAFLVLQNPFLAEFRTVAAQVARLANLYRLLAGWLASWKAQVEAKPAGTAMTFEMQIPGGNPDAPPANVTMVLTEEAYTFDGLWPALTQDPNAIRIPPDGAYLVAMGGDRPVDLRAYDHEGAFVRGARDALARVPDVAQRLDRVMERLVQTSGRPFTAGAHAAWAQQVGQAGRDVHAILEIVLAELIRTSTEMAPHLAVLPGLDGFSLDSHGRIGPPLYPIAFHLATQAELDALLRAHPRLNAHLAYQGFEPLRIDLMGISGKLVISSNRAPIEVANLVVASREEDIVVLAGEDVTLKGGTIDASVIVRNRLRVKGETTVRGNLVLDTLARHHDRGPSEELKGTVLYNPGLYSGRLKSRVDARNVLWTHYALGLSPVAEEVDIQWLK
jgi:hypothetical protein